MLFLKTMEISKMVLQNVGFSALSKAMLGVFELVAKITFFLFSEIYF
jgi:hypothetical protein